MRLASEDFTTMRSLADELNDGLTGYLIERALDEARVGSIGHARNASYS